MFDHLYSLARETASHKRRELMSEIADLFVSGADNYGDRELFLFGEVLTTLLESVDMEGRTELSETVAGVLETPRELALNLAHDDIEVATPVIEHSPVLTEKDLVDIAMATTTEYRLAISRREALTVNVTDALIVHGEQPVMNSVCGNNTAQISNGGFNTLADCAGKDPELCDRLSHRGDMPKKVMKRVMPLLSPQARQRLEQLVAANEDAIVDFLVDKASWTAKKARDEDQQKKVQAHVFLDQIQKGQKSLDQVIELLCQGNRPLDLGYVLAGLTKLPETQITNALLKPNPEPLIILCRSLGLSSETFTEIAYMRGKRFQLSMADSEKLIRKYAAFDMTTAQRTMRFVKLRNDEPRAVA